MYKKLIEFAMRTFIEKVLNAYIEYLEDTQYSNMSDEEIADIQQTFNNFKVWLYKIMK